MLRLSTLVKLPRTLPQLPKPALGSKTMIVVRVLLDTSSATPPSRPCGRGRCSESDLTKRNSEKKKNQSRTVWLETASLRDPQHPFHPKTTPVSWAFALSCPPDSQGECLGQPDSRYSHPHGLAQEDKGCRCI